MISISKDSVPMNKAFVIRNHGINEKVNFQPKAMDRQYTALWNIHFLVTETRKAQIYSDLELWEKI